ncbi:Uma2 family endonuclease [Streptomyces coeruleorubidus]|uniref:Uma2 family endonuclease n=1 Tax=Streptomyces coeruleorubidus TaxID=116188 RepID=UPI0036F948D8
MEGRRRRHDPRHDRPPADGCRGLRRTRPQGPDGALMAVEITSHDRDTDRRDRIDKPVGYAAADIPVYLLIDRDNHTLTVFSEPQDGRYQQISPHPWGATVELPAPVNITLDTEKLKDYAD